MDTHFFVTVDTHFPLTATEITEIRRLMDTHFSLTALQTATVDTHYIGSKKWVSTSSFRWAE